ncbi:hypothetical protein BB560_005791, partial [Smittium megazygosporum]
MTSLKNYPLLVLLPPVGVYLVVGPTVEFVVNIALTMLFYLPGLVHALLVVNYKQRGRNNSARNPPLLNPQPCGEYHSSGSVQ